MEKLSPDQIHKLFPHPFFLLSQFSPIVFFSSSPIRRISKDPKISHNLFLRPRKIFAAVSVWSCCECLEQFAVEVGVGGGSAVVLLCRSVCERCCNQLALQLTNL